MSESEQFVTRGREFVKTHPDYFDVLNDAEARLKNVSGPTLPEDAADEIKKLARPDIACFLALPENQPEAQVLLSMKGERARDKVRRLASRLERHGTFRTVTSKPDEVEAYLAQRREDRRSGKRRR
jgi:hypothetical protein